jgi:hypothetical protein
MKMVKKVIEEFFSPTRHKDVDSSRLECQAKITSERAQKMTAIMQANGAAVRHMIEAFEEELNK